MKGKFKTKVGSHVADRYMRSSFGCSSEVAFLVWNMIDLSDLNPQSRKCMYMLWEMLFLKVYATEVNSVAMIVTKSCQKTFRNWVHVYVKKIASLFDQVVSLL